MKILFWLIIVVVGFVLYVRYLERVSVFLPDKGIKNVPTDDGLGYEDISLKVDDNVTLHGWYVPNSTAKSTLIFFHGNAGNLGDRLHKIRIFHDLGLNVLLFDYRGYGKSTGRSNEKNFYADAEKIYDYALTRGIKPEEIVLCGASLGGAAAIDLSAKNKEGVVIVIATFSNAVDMAKLMYPFIPSFLVNIKLDSLSKIDQVEAPILIVHSQTDTMIPIELSKKLFDRAIEPKEFLTLEGNHGDAFVTDYDTFTAGMREFLKQYGMVN